MYHALPIFKLCIDVSSSFDSQGVFFRFHGRRAKIVGQPETFPALMQIESSDQLQDGLRGCHCGRSGPLFTLICFRQFISVTRET